MKNIISSLSLALLLVSCQHTINFRSAKYAVPIVNEKQFGGQVAAVLQSPTKVTLVNDMETNPPSRTAVELNVTHDIIDILDINTIGADLGLNLFPHVMLYLENL